MLKKNKVVYYFTQPDFLAHYHLHRQKIELLRSKDIESWHLVIVSKNFFELHKDELNKILQQGYTKIIVTENIEKTDKELYQFIWKNLFFYNKIIFHVLRNSPKSIIKIKKNKIIGSRIKLVIEYEGHQPSELIYQETYKHGNKPPEIPPQNILNLYSNFLNKQIYHVKKSDAVVLMSEEHFDLWSNILGYKLKGCVLPSLPNTIRVNYNQTLRITLRKQLGLENYIVLVYVGNVVGKWQRFEETCEFIRDFVGKIKDIRFLALVRQSDLEQAQTLISETGINSISLVRHAHESIVKDYLSASDFGLFLRHHHTMNKVVTSAKLGEYLAAGLPVITTGANAEVLNRFIIKNNAGVFINDSLKLDLYFLMNFNKLLKASLKSNWRKKLSDNFYDFTSSINNYSNGYIRMLSDL